MTKSGNESGYAGKEEPEKGKIKEKRDRKMHIPERTDKNIRFSGG